jgi:hypothetical protein
MLWTVTSSPAMRSMTLARGTDEGYLPWRSWSRTRASQYLSFGAQFVQNVHKSNARFQQGVHGLGRTAPALPYIIATTDARMVLTYSN